MGYNNIEYSIDKNNDIWLANIKESKVDIKYDSITNILTFDISNYDTIKGYESDIDKIENYFKTNYNFKLNYIGGNNMSVYPILNILKYYSIDNSIALNCHILYSSMDAYINVKKKKFKLNKKQILDKFMFDLKTVFSTYINSYPIIKIKTKQHLLEYNNIIQYGDCIEFLN